MSDRFYTTATLVPGEFQLTGAEAHHIATVRRFSPGDQVTLFNGSGEECTAELVGLTKSRVSLRILSTESVNRELAFPLVIASAIPKGDRADFLIEKLTELGVMRFIPLITHRSVVVPKTSVVAKYARAVIEASKQCGRNRLMVVNPPLTWSALLRREDLPEARLVLNPSIGATSMQDRQKGVAIAVGPEGGFTPGEMKAAADAGWSAVTLGPRVLRVETAAVAAAAILAHQPNQ